MNNPMLRADREYSLNDYKLKPYQNETVDFMLRRFSCLNNSQTGAGKTLVSLTACQHCLNYSNTLQVVILCPKAALSSFKKELTNMIKAPYSIYTATEYKIVEGARYHLFTYSKLDLLVEWLDKNKGCPKILVVDEAHKLNSPSTKTYKTLSKLRKEFNVVYGLTATPLMNDLYELYYVINFIVPGFLGTKKAFEQQYLITKLVDKYFYGKKIKKKEVIGTKNLDHLSKRLTSILIGKKNKYNLDFQYRAIPLTDDEGMEYRECAKGLLNDVGEAKSMSARLHDLQRVIDGSHENFPKSRLCSKEKLLVTVLKEILDRNESTLIYVEYMSTFNRLLKVLKASKQILNYSNTYMICGEVKLEDRVKVEKEMPRRSIVLLTKAGTASINLQKANNLIFYDLPWSTGDTIQAIGRITRMDTKYDTQHIYFIEALDTIDTFRRKVIESKVSLITAIFGEQTTMPKVEDGDINLDDLRKYLLWRRRSRKK